MAQMETGHIRFDPYKNFRFRVRWEGRYVAGFDEMGGLNLRIEPTTSAEGSDISKERRLPGQSEFAAVTLERGITHDTEFEKWASKEWNIGQERRWEPPTAESRKDIRIDEFDEAGAKVASYTVPGSWVSEFQALSDLDANANAAAIQHLKLENEGWKRYDWAGKDREGSEWKNVPVRRMEVYLEESLYRDTKWVVFEPNDEPLWAKIRLNVESFMQDLFLQGAFQGKTPREAYFVKCGRETISQNDLDNGIVNIEVGFAPLKPAEFVVITIRQLAGKSRSDGRARRKP